MSIVCTPDDVVQENIAPTPVAPDEPYIVVTVAITIDEAKTLIETLPSNQSDARKVRDAVSRAVLEAIQDSPYNPQ